MATYVIGDVQGCLRSLETLLAKIGFSAKHDRLWFVGDLVNRGPDSLGVLRFVRDLGDRAVTVLGNHDLHLLAFANSGSRETSPPSLAPVLGAPDRDELLLWLRHQPLFHFDQDLDWAMVHAGVYPGWSVHMTKNLSDEVHKTLRGDDCDGFFSEMYGNEPASWHSQLTGADRLRFIVNVFTRLRYMRGLELEFTEKDAPEAVLESTPELLPWFNHPQGVFSGESTRLVFGHWSTLPPRQYDKAFATDGGCLWGGKLVALEIDKTLAPVWHSIDCERRLQPCRNQVTN
ncbi:MAG: symmetrical bis(5'-nucleosyl)-tetraphosphatase [Gammaproteobacteria bacterium]|nr:symmetrical bis(5'-nucleosyl)-tetraphosphatase [Gammaproteobacteria bacterium]